MFPQARIVPEGAFLTPQGNCVQTVYLDLSGKVEAKGLCLVKATEPHYDLATASTIRLSRPGVFRYLGEVLIQDEQEGRAETSTSESVDEPGEEPELTSERILALNAALQLGRNPRSPSVRGSDVMHTRSNTSTAAVTFGRDWLIYCTSMRPSKDEEEAMEEDISRPLYQLHAPSIVRPSLPKLWGSACAHTSASVARRSRCGGRSTDSGPWRSGAGAK